MAGPARSPSEPGLVALEEELTCSICLCLFSSPVTVPCGHNFCSSCLELCWAGLSANFSCPQCRATFAGRPGLQKNTVLCRVVEQLRGRAGLGAAEEEEAEDEAAGRGAQAPQICCDSCLRAPAVQTCLTCTASFCSEHLRPHRDSPAFRDHQLCPPLRDLKQRKCPQHNKLFEFFCDRHGTCICSLCLLGHKLCPTSPLQVAKANAQVSGWGAPRSSGAWWVAGGWGRGLWSAVGGGRSKTCAESLLPGLGEPLSALQRASSESFLAFSSPLETVLQGSGKALSWRRLPGPGLGWADRRGPRLGGCHLQPRASPAARCTGSAAWPYRRLTEGLQTDVALWVFLRSKEL